MIPEVVDCGVFDTMDPAFDKHCHRIDRRNFIEYRSLPHPSKVKYTPPSPTTSGYSESSGEMDNPDSGRVSEMEGSPKMHPRRPGTISLNMEMFSANQSQTSPDPFPEGKSTIKMGRSTSSDGASHSESPQFLVISEQTLRTLVVSLHDTRTRLDRMETKIGALVKVFQLHCQQSNESSRKLATAVLALGNAYKTEKIELEPENGRHYPKFQETILLPDRKVPVPCNNNNLLSSTTESEKTQSCEHLRLPSASPHKLHSKSSDGNDFDPSTFPRFTRPGNEPSPLSLAPSPGDANLEKQDNISDDRMAFSSQGKGVAANADDKTKVSPVYAIVKKTKKSTETSDSDAYDSSSLPRRSCDLMPSTDHGPSQLDVDAMMQIVQELKEGSDAVVKDDTFSNGESLTRVSRFSEVESLLSTLGTSTIFSDDKSSTDSDEELDRNLVVEEYDNKDTELFEEDVFSPSPYRNSNSGVVMHEFPYEKREVLPNSSWPAAQHEISYSSAPIVQAASLSTPSKDNARQSDHSLLEGSSEFAATKGDVSDKKSKKKSGSEKNLSSYHGKKPNVIVANYSKLFKRKGKKKRSESQNSFYFVTSPLYEAQVKHSKRQQESPQRVRRGASFDSVISSERDLITSFLNVPFSNDDSTVLGPSEEAPPSRVDETVTSSLLLGSNSHDFELEGTGGEVEDIKESYDNLDDPNSEDMRPNIVKIAKRAFRNSPKILRRNKSTPVVQTAELRPKIPNGHARAHESSLPSTPELSLKESSTTSESNLKNSTFTQDGDVEEDVFVPPGVILERLQREQADRIRFETGHSSALDNPPPKPQRPGFNHGGLQGSPRSSVNAHSNGNVPGYPRGMPAVPPKQKIMTPEELTNHEAQENLLRKQREDAMLQQKLNEQQKQAVENAAWLKQEEQMLNPDLNGEDPTLRRGRGSSNSITDMRGAIEAPPPPSVAPSKPPRKSSRPKDEPAGPPQTKLEEVKTAPTMQLNRDNDEVYKNTMEVVKAVLGMNNMTMNAKPDELFTSVKSVGAALKQLCASLEIVLPDLPEDFHREIDMAQRTTNKDLSQVINQLKLVQRFYTTTQVVDYKKCLMAANQVLAIDAKNLLDVVDRARIRKIQTAQEKAKAQAEDVRLGAVSSSAATGYEPEDLYPDGEFL